VALLKADLLPEASRRGLGGLQDVGHDTRKAKVLYLQKNMSWKFAFTGMNW
jgi:hypothetical protein